jgi:vacuolar-type H+-ATPase subunit I/STV1
LDGLGAQELVDVLAIAVAAGGFVLAWRGHHLVGAVVSGIALAGLAVALARNRRLSTVLPFSFGSHFVVMLLFVIAWAVARNRFAGPSVALLGFWPYYYACIALVERKVRYVPWGAGLGLSWRTAHSATQPRAYWVVVTLAFGIAALLFALGLASV